METKGNLVFNLNYVFTNSVYGFLWCIDLSITYTSLHDHMVLVMTDSHSIFSDPCCYIVFMLVPSILPLASDLMSDAVYFSLWWQNFLFMFLICFELIAWSIQEIIFFIILQLRWGWMNYAARYSIMSVPLNLSLWPRLISYICVLAIELLGIKENVKDAVDDSTLRCEYKECELGSVPLHFSVSLVSLVTKMSLRIVCLAEWFHP